MRRKDPIARRQDGARRFDLAGVCGLGSGLRASIARVAFATDCNEPCQRRDEREWHALQVALRVESRLREK